MQAITTTYSSFPFQPLHGETIDTQELTASVSFAATLNGVTCYVEPISPAQRTDAAADFVTWFCSLQMLPPHVNVLPYGEKLVACPSFSNPNMQNFFLVVPASAAAATISGTVGGQLLPLPAYMDELKGQNGETPLVLSEDAIRIVAMDVLCAIHHLRLHGLEHRYLTPHAIYVNTATGNARLGCMGSSIDVSSGCAARNMDGVEAIADVKGLGHVMLALMGANGDLSPPSADTANAVLETIISDFTQGKSYSPDLADFAYTCLTSGTSNSELLALFQHRFLLPITVSDVHRSRSLPLPAAAAFPVSASSVERQQSHPDQRESSLPSLLKANPFARGESSPLTPHTSLDNISEQAGTLAERLPVTTAGIGSPFSPGSLQSRSRMAPAKLCGGDVHVITCGTALPNREQYYFIEAGKRHYLADYGLLFELEASRRITLEDVFFVTAGDVGSMHVQLFWKAGGLLADGGSSDNKERPLWIPVLRRPKHLRKVMAHKPQSVGPFSVHLSATVGAGAAGGDGGRHVFLLATNYAHGVRYYGLPHGLFGQPVGGPLDTDGIICISTGLPCGVEVCTATTDTLRAQTAPKGVEVIQEVTKEGEESSEEDEVEDPREERRSNDEDALHIATRRATASAALDKAIAGELAKQQDCPGGLCGGLKYTVIA